MLKKIRILPVLFAVSIFGAFGINNAWATTSLDPCPISGWYNCGMNCCAPTAEQCDDYCDGSATILSYKVTDASSTDSYTCSTTTYTGGSTNCPSSTQSGGTASNCSASNYFCYQYKSKTASTYTKRKQTYCTSCPSGYELQKTTVTRSGTGCKIQYNSCVKAATTPCANLACAGKTVWTNLTDTYYGVGTQYRCNTSTNKCEYRCRAGYYNAATDAPRHTYCQRCPSNVIDGSCNAATQYGNICCDTGYYLGKSRGVRPKDPDSSAVQLTQYYYIYTCTRCPEINGVYGTTPSNSCPAILGNSGTTIDTCYIPSGVDIDDNTGTYEFTGDCNWDPDVQTGTIIGPGGGGTIVTP